MTATDSVNRWDMQFRWGPWVGVSEAQQHLCAVEGCTSEGKPHVCFADGASHHHGCVHYDTVKEPTHGLTLRDGWGWLCDEHYEQIKQAFPRNHLTGRARPAV